MEDGELYLENGNTKWKLEGWHWSATVNKPSETCLSPFYSVVNPRRTWAARVTLVGLSVCLFDAYSGTTGYEAAY